MKATLRESHGKNKLNWSSREVMVRFSSPDYPDAGQGRLYVTCTDEDGQQTVLIFPEITAQSFAAQVLQSLA